MAEERLIPTGIDVTTPNVARMYDYYLGGKDHYEADRRAAQAVVDKDPSIRTALVENRKFLGRAVRFLSGEVGQFVDIGSGLPTRDNVHQVAQRANPEARVVYVDNDPVVLIHNRMLLTSHADTVATIQGDLRQPDTILRHPELRKLIDLRQPVVVVLLLAVLHFVSDDADPHAQVQRIKDAMAPGSYLVISHGTAEDRPEDSAAVVTQTYQRATSQVRLRPREQILRFFDGLELVEPGLVFPTRWHPDGAVSAEEADAGRWGFVGVARKP